MKLFLLLICLQQLGTKQHQKTAKPTKLPSYHKVYLLCPNCLTNLKWYVRESEICMAIKAVVFDLDGTIAAFNLDYKVMRGEVRSYLLNMGVPASLLQVNETIFEMLKKTEIYLKNQGKPPEAMEKIRQETLKVAEKYELDAAKQTNLLSGAFETLKMLRLAGLKIGLCTLSSEKSTMFLLQRFKLDGYFDAVVSRDRVNHVKPNPEHLQAVLEKLDATAKETMFVGDSTTDMQGAKELKVIAVGLPSGVSTQQQLITHGANYIVTSITDLPVLIERLNKPEPPSNEWLC